MVWMLILTLAGIDGAAIHSAPGFESKHACQQAGKEWSQNLNGQARMIDSYVCVDSGEK